MDIKTKIAKLSTDDKQDVIEDVLANRNTESGEKLSNSEIGYVMLEGLEYAIKEVNAMRKGSEDEPAVDISFEQYAKDRWNVEGKMESIMEKMGIELNNTSIDRLLTSSDLDPRKRWIIPEFIRSLVQTGRDGRHPYTYRDLITGTESVRVGAETKVPILHGAKVNFKFINDGESVEVDAKTSMAEKTIYLKELATGMQITKRARQMSLLNLIRHFYREVGYQMNDAMRVEALKTIINGDGNVTGGVINPAVSVVGVENTANGITYNDLAMAWMTLGDLGRVPTGMFMGRKEILKVKKFDELKTRETGRPEVDAEIHAILPADLHLYPESRLGSENRILLVDKTRACTLFTATGLMVDTEQMLSNRTGNIYIRQEMAFANMYDDAQLMIDGTQDLNTLPYPSWTQKDEFEF